MSFDCFWKYFSYKKNVNFCKFQNISGKSFEFKREKLFLLSPKSEIAKFDYKLRRLFNT